MENMVVDALKSTYFGKKVFVTGHTGFKGAWLLKILSFLGAEIKGYALSPQNSFDLYNLINGDNLCESVIADLRNKKSLEDAILTFQPDFIFHLAAQPLVRQSYEDPLQTFEINAIGTANLLESVRLLKYKCSVVLITTDKVYQNNEWVFPYRETDRLGGFDPYSASKACSELIINCFKNSYFGIDTINQHNIGISVARAGNVIGGGDWSRDRLIPDIINSFLSNQVLTVRNPQSIRPWQFVLEPLLGYLILGDKLSLDPIKYGTSYNFGPHSFDVVSVNNMVEKAREIIGKGTYLKSAKIDEFHEAGVLKLDISKAINELNWLPKYNSEIAIKKTIEWYRHFSLDESTIIEFTENQIIEFLNDK